MTDRPAEIPDADPPFGLRLFGQTPADDAVESSAIVDEESSGDVDALPDDLLSLGERLTSEARVLAKTYPPRAIDRLPIGGETAPAPLEGDAAKVLESAADVPAKVVEPTTAAGASPGRRFGLGLSAAAALAALIGSALYFANSETAPQTGQVVPATSGDVPGGASSIANVPIRTVSLSLANESDYRRLEGLLRDRSEPEREALFDLLGEYRPGGEDGDETTAVRISF